MGHARFSVRIHQIKSNQVWPANFHMGSGFPRYSGGKSNHETFLVYLLRDKLSGTAVTSGLVL
jgi:hypothetical protein